MCVCLNDKTKRDEKIISCRFDTVCIQFKLEPETNTAKNTKQQQPSQFYGCKNCERKLNK